MRRGSATAVLVGWSGVAVAVVALLVAPVPRGVPPEARHPAVLVVAPFLIGGPALGALLGGGVALRGGRGGRPAGGVLLAASLVALTVGAAMCVLWWVSVAWPLE